MILVEKGMKRSLQLKSFCSTLIIVSKRTFKHLKVVGSLQNLTFKEVQGCPEVGNCWSTIMKICLAPLDFSDVWALLRQSLLKKLTWDFQGGFQNWLEAGGWTKNPFLTIILVNFLLCLDMNLIHIWLNKNRYES